MSLSKKNSLVSVCLVSLLVMSIFVANNTLVSQPQSPDSTYGPKIDHLRYSVHYDGGMDIPGEGPPDEVLYVDGYREYTESGWSGPPSNLFGTPDGLYIESSVDCSLTSLYSFENITLGDRIIAEVELEAYSKCADTATDIDAYIFTYDEEGNPVMSAAWANSQGGTTDWAWTNKKYYWPQYSFPEYYGNHILTEQGINSAELMIHNYGGGNVQIDSYRMSIWFQGPYWPNLYGLRAEAMQNGYIDVLTDLEMPVDVEKLDDECFTITATLSFQFCYIAFNLKNWWLGPQNGSDGPGRALRHAMAHLVPKDELIGTLFKYLVTKIEAPGPPAQGEWYNSNVDPHTYDPDMAHDILTYDSNWVWDAGDGRWELGKSFAGHSAGEPMPTTIIYSPESAVAPTSWEIVKTTVARMTGAGPFAAHPLPVFDVPIDFAVLSDILDFEPNRSSSYDAGGWDAYFGGYGGLGNSATFLFNLFHSSQDVEIGDNQMHLNNAALDAELDVINTSLDHAAKVAAAHTAYELLMGNTAYQYDPTTNGIIASIPIYSLAHYNAFNPELRGIVNAPGLGSDNMWTGLNMHWTPGLERMSDLVPGGTMASWCLNYPPLTPLGPLSPRRHCPRATVPSWEILNRIFDPLIAVNPYTLEHFAWILNATKDPDYPDTPGYYVEPWGDGMKVTYYLVDDTPLWQDGHQVDAFDCEFAWEYQVEYQIGQWWETFMYFDHADVIDVPYNRTVAAYLTETSQFTPLVLAEMALMFPEHIWGCTHERGGRATPSCVYVSEYAEMYDGTPITVESGICGCAPGTPHTAPEKTTCEHGCGCVIDHPGTPENEVYAYDPIYYAHATPEFPWLTELIGSGPFIFRSYNPTAMVADIVAFDAARTGSGGDPNVHYWKTTDELYQNLVDMFWEAGDVNRDGVVDQIDMDRMDAAAGCWWWEPCYDPDCDLNSDGVVDMKDFTRLSLNFGRWREYPADIADVAVHEASTYPTAVPGQDVKISIKAKNRGSTDRTVNFTYYYDDVFIGYQIVTLAPCQSNVSFTWDTTGVPEGTYTIKVNATVVDGPDINLADNLYVDGEIRFAIPAISVDPQQSIVGSAGKNLSVNISITDAPYNNTWAWQFKLSWDPALLNITDIDESTFLTQSGTWATAFVNVTNQEEGWVLASCTLVDDPIEQGQPLPYGNGILATINFTVLDVGSCTLHLYDTILLDYEIDPYSHTTQDGEFEVLLGDINRDGIVDDEDLEIIDLAFGSSPGDSAWNPEADIWGPDDEPDGVIDVYDLAMWGKKYGETP